MSCLFIPLHAKSEPDMKKCVRFLYNSKDQVPARCAAKEHKQKPELDFDFLFTGVSCSLLRLSSEMDQEHARRLKEFKYLTL